MGRIVLLRRCGRFLLLLLLRIVLLRCGGRALLLLLRRGRSPLLLGLALLFRAFLGRTLLGRALLFCTFLGGPLLGFALLFCTRFSRTLLGLALQPLCTLLWRLGLDRHRARNYGQQSHYYEARHGPGERQQPGWRGLS